MLRKFLVSGKVIGRKEETRFFGLHITIAYLAAEWEVLARRVPVIDRGTCSAKSFRRFRATQWSSAQSFCSAAAWSSTAISLCFCVVMNRLCRFTLRRRKERGSRVCDYHSACVPHAFTLVFLVLVAPRDYTTYI